MIAIIEKLKNAKFKYYKISKVKLGILKKSKKNKINNFYLSVVMQH